MKRLYLALAGCAAFFVFCNASGCKSSDKTTAEKTVEAPAPAQPQPAAEPAPAPAPTDPSKAQQVRISTKFGNMTVMLYNETPQLRDNFLKLVKEKYYDLRYGGGGGKGVGEGAGVGRVGKKVYGSIDSIGWKYCTIGRYRLVVGGRWSGVGGRGSNGLGVGCW